MLPPYVDEYGETDQGLKRGNPMTLDVEKYEQLRRSWMLHLIPEEIARIVENSTSISNTEWQYL
jgi:E3 ubiquitin-protein ligase UBR2